MIKPKKFPLAGGRHELLGPLGLARRMIKDHKYQLNGMDGQLRWMRALVINKSFKDDEEFRKDFSDESSMENPMNNWMIWEACAELIRWNSERRQPIPVEVARLARDYMLGNISKPTRKGRHENVGRKYTIFEIVETIAREFPELSATRNEASFEKESACDIAAEALQEYGINISGRGVEKVWERERRWRNSLSDK